MHEYFFKYNYDAPNCVTGKQERKWTGRGSIIANSKQEAMQTVEQYIKESRPEASNIRNITFK